MQDYVIDLCYETMFCGMCNFFEMFAIMNIIILNLRLIKVYIDFLRTMRD